MQCVYLCNNNHHRYCYALYVDASNGFAQSDGRSTGEDPERRKHRLRDGEDEGVEGVGAVGDVVEHCGSFITVEQDADAARVWVVQHRLTAVVPG